MSSDIAISVENLSKCFHIYSRPSDRLKQMLVVGKKQYFNEFWAVKDISFDIKKGETVGIVGRNGSGKSTLLQLVCSIFDPTGGSIKANGRIAALLELGSGFNPEFTGRDNVYMNAAILGLSHKEIDARFDDIAEFADIGQFIEQPVKTYSSGMMMRLAFAVAINVEPQILVIDEALSVGDELFQRKCFARIQKIKENGATILFVSHSGGAIIELCDRAILIDDGELLLDGKPKNIIGKYQKLLYASEEQKVQVRDQIKGDVDANYFLDKTVDVDKSMNDDPVAQEINNEWMEQNLLPQSTISYESNGARIEDIKILTLDGRQVNNLVRNAKYKYQYKVYFQENCEYIRFGMLIKTRTGLELGGQISASSLEESVLFLPSESVAVVSFEFTAVLSPDIYFLNAGVSGIVNQEETYLHRILDAYVFRVLPDETSSLLTGVVDFRAAGKAVDIEVQR